MSAIDLAPVDDNASHRLASMLRKTAVETDFGYTLPTGLIAAWVSCGANFQLSYDIHTSTGLDGLTYWWLQHGRYTFPGLADIIDAGLIFDLHFKWINKSSLQSLAVTPLMEIIYRHRPDLPELFDTNEIEGRSGLWQWWLATGHKEYSRSGSESDIDGREALSSIAVLSQITSRSPDDIVEPQSEFVDSIYYQALVAFSRLQSDHGGEIAELLDGIHLRHISQCLENRLPTPLMALVYRNRPDLQPIFSLDDKDVDANFWSWWLENGANEYFPPLDALRIREATAILSDLGSYGAGFVDTLRYRAFLSLSRTVDSESKEIAELLTRVHFRYLRKNPEDTRWTPLMGFVYRNRPDLQNAFPVKEKVSQVDFRKWWNHFADTEYALKKRPVHDNPPAKDHSLPAEPENRHTSIALAGYPRGEFGLGEDIRLLRASLQTVGVEPDVIRVPWKITAREGINEQITEADEADFGSDVMIYVMPAFDTLTLLNKVGTRAFSARRKIGYWQWELSKFPEPAMMAFDLVDEVWCHSEHSAKAFREATDKPVIRVPLPVQPPAFEHVARSTFNLNENSFIVFTSFDGASSISRKNPMAAILAFQKAFPRNTHPDVQLVVKAMNALDDGLWRDCVRKSYLDDRIHIRNEVLDRDAYYQLLACCDVVLSMHRAEGFGRLMAEAMAIGIPVISTGYSGNLDFMTQDNSWLIPGQICKLVPGDYSFYKGQEWMEPDIDKAAEALRDCLVNPAKRECLIANAKKTLDRYSLQNCGKQYLALIAGKN
ncbi:glycosyltransferase family 4 protein [Rhizobium rhizogenes]